MQYTIQDFNKTKKETACEIDNLIALICEYEKQDESQNPMENDHIKALIEQKKKVLNGIFRIMIVGQFNNGKSTFLNALLKEKVLPVGATETQATINIIKYGETKKVKLNYYGKIDDNGKEISSGKIVEIGYTDLERYTTALTDEADKNSKQIKFAEIYYPTEYCKNGVEIIDTPGLNSTYDYHEKATLDYLPNGNAAIMLMRASQFFQESEERYLKMFREFINKIIFVVNYWNDDEYEEFKEEYEYFVSKIKESVNTGCDITLYLINTKKALEGDVEKSGFSKFIIEMEKFLTSSEKAKEMICQPLTYSSSIIQTYHNNLKLKINSLNFSPEFFEKKIKENEPLLAQIKDRKKDILSFFEMKGNRLLECFQIESNKYVRPLLNEVSSYILNYEGDIQDDLKNDLNSFIKEKVVDMSLNIENRLKIDIDEIKHEVLLRIKDFNEDLLSYQANLVQGNFDSLNLDFKYNDCTIADFASFLGVGFGIGCLSAMLFTGPIGWVVAGVGYLLSVVGLDFNIKQRELKKIRDEVLGKIEKNFTNTLPEIKHQIKNILIQQSTLISEKMENMLISVEKTISEIKREMNLEREKIENKKMNHIKLLEKFMQQKKSFDKYFNLF
ncbi:dynamin family protein [Candidatus Dependentiae bacterium]|nr:dynamin family protein [Candidatus Dependentiae bacterium]